MSPWNGPAYPGAKRDLRKLKRTEAEARSRKTCPSCLFRLDSDTHRIVCLRDALPGRAA